MKIISFPLLFLTVFITKQNCSAQLLEKLRKSQNLQRSLNYVDKENNYYMTKRQGGIEMDILFTNVRFNQSNKTYLIEGVTVSPTIKDTVGICCIKIFLGKTKGDTLYNKRPLGESNSQDNDLERKKGFFSFQTKIHAGDKLFFCAANGGNLKEYFLDSILSLKKDSK